MQYNHIKNTIIGLFIIVCFLFSGSTVSAISSARNQVYRQKQVTSTQSTAKKAPLISQSVSRVTNKIKTKEKKLTSPKITIPSKTIDTLKATEKTSPPPTGPCSAFANVIGMWDNKIKFIANPTDDNKTCLVEIWGDSAILPGEHGAQTALPIVWQFNYPGKITTYKTSLKNGCLGQQKLVNNIIEKEVWWCNYTPPSK